MVAIPLLFVSSQPFQTKGHSFIASRSFVPNRQTTLPRKILGTRKIIITPKRQYATNEKLDITKLFEKKSILQDVNEFPQYVDDPSSKVMYTYYNKKDMRGLQLLNIFIFLFTCFCIYFFMTVFKAKKRLSKVEETQNEVLERTVTAMCKGDQSLDRNNEFVKLKSQLEDYNFEGVTDLSFSEYLQLGAISTLLIISVFLSKRYIKMNFFTAKEGSLPQSIEMSYGNLFSPKINTNVYYYPTMNITKVPPIALYHPEAAITIPEYVKSPLIIRTDPANFPNFSLFRNYFLADIKFIARAKFRE